MNLFFPLDFSGLFRIKIKPKLEYEIDFFYCYELYILIVL